MYISFEKKIATTHMRVCSTLFLFVSGKYCMKCSVAYFGLYIFRGSGVFGGLLGDIILFRNAKKGIGTNHYFIKEFM